MCAQVRVALCVRLREGIVFARLCVSSRGWLQAYASRMPVVPGTRAGEWWRFARAHASVDRAYTPAWTVHIYASVDRAGEHVITRMRRAEEGAHCLGVCARWRHAPPVCVYCCSMDGRTRARLGVQCVCARAG